MSLKIKRYRAKFNADTTHGKINFAIGLRKMGSNIFTPKNFTPVCTTELGSLQKLRSLLMKEM